MRGLHAKIVLSSTTHTHRELTSSTLLQKHARLNLALRRSLVLDHRKLVHLATSSLQGKVGRFSILFPFYFIFGCASTPLRFCGPVHCKLRQREESVLKTFLFAVNLMTTGRSYFWRPSWVLRHRWWEQLQRIRSKATWRCEISQASSLSKMANLLRLINSSRNTRLGNMSFGRTTLITSATM
jgi:hypothetical protein